LKHIYTSIDLGSDSIKIVVCELFQNKLNLLAATSFKSSGIKNGLIVDPELASSSLRGAIHEIESMLNFKIDKVLVSVPSNHASFTAIQGKIEVNGIVEAEHINEVLTSAYRTKDISNKEMVTIVPIDFSTDNEDKVKDPKGLETSLLSARAIMVSVPRKNVYSVLSILDSLSLEVIDIMIGSVGDISAFKTKENSSLVGAIINIGSETTNVSLYNKSIVVKNSIIGMGGKNIDQDIAYVYKLNPKDATKIKETFALASSKYASRNDFYEVMDKFGDIRKISQREVSELTQSILEEILVLSRKEINLLTKQPIDYIIITGGTSSMAGFESLAEELLGQIVTIGSIRIPGVRNNKYSTALGNVVYFINKLKLKGIDYTMVNQDFDHEGNQETSSESMLGKVFGYFFNE
jgi:cell division protein FtsA